MKQYFIAPFRIYRRRTGLLTEFYTLFLDDQGQVTVSGDRISQYLLQIYLRRRGIDQIGATNNFSDPHIMIINHNTEMVGGNIVTAMNDKVTD